MRRLGLGLLLLFALPQVAEACQFWVRYATAATLQGIPLITRGAVDFKANPTLAAGDVTISQDGGAAANLATLPDAEPNSSSYVRVELSSGETTAKLGVITFVDQTAAKEWEDQRVIVCTYGHASAFLPNIPGPEVATTGGFPVIGTGSGNVSVDGSGNINANTAKHGGAAVSAAVGGNVPAVAIYLETQAKEDVAAQANLFREDVAHAVYIFKMVDATDLKTAETGIAGSIDCEISKNGAAFANIATNTATEISNGWYYVALSAVDLSATSSVIKCTGTGAHPHEQPIYTQR